MALFGARKECVISIHALREEGDLELVDAVESSSEFLSTPSARRATVSALANTTQLLNFYPRPPRGGRPCKKITGLTHVGISIHALREEGDNTPPQAGVLGEVFLSTPSARRATCCPARIALGVQISIHALREEGDCSA